jgi:uncharacterized membrane protein
MMNIMIAGLVMFLGLHSLPMFGSARDAIRLRLGNNAYRGGFSLISAVGLGLIIWGKSLAPLEVLWSPPPIGRSLTQWLMPLALVLFVAGNFRGHIRARLRHPMLIGALIWSVCHLLANGDRASTWLFGSFATWALLDLISAWRRGPVGISGPSAKHDLIAVVVGLAGFAVVFHYHALLFGLPAR